MYLGCSSRMVAGSKPPVIAQMCGAEPVCITRCTHAGVFLRRSSGGTSVLAGERMAFSRNKVCLLSSGYVFSWGGKEMSLGITKSFKHRESSFFISVPKP